MVSARPPCCVASVIPKIDLYPAHVVAGACVNIMGTCRETRNMSLSGQNILLSPQQVTYGCCQMETLSFLLGDSPSVNSAISFPR